MTASSGAIGFEANSSDTGNTYANDKTDIFFNNQMKTKMRQLGFDSDYENYNIWIGNNINLLAYD